ncbi:hypothetical protein [Pseudaestuariivita atlantica]|uniref:Uncharacterized protein n=1 Tax=Pseudaestuariivita atlantica TaxID=1317121 RepID=A0A0L1JS65_9RHOB|nr:hypothetical protein [Pseudaestuariivita atlantica]KNG94634.1 hypothetical protein ATO11_04320 [Pseudaestuariivita atlantica]
MTEDEIQGSLDATTIPFTDVVLNLFAVLMLVLLLFPANVVVTDAPAPTQNPPGQPLVSLRECTLSALRPVSRFVHVSEKGMRIVPYDAFGADYAASLRANLISENGAFEMGVERMIERRDFNAMSLSVDIIKMDPRPGTAARNIALLNQEIFDRGYAAYFSVTEGGYAAFAQIFPELIASGVSFRWALTEERLRRERTELVFEDSGFCR